MTDGGGAPSPDDIASGPVGADPYWRAIAQLLNRLPIAGRPVLLPSGDWSVPGIAPRFYRHDEVVPATDDYDVVVINKATIPSFSQTMVRRLLSSHDYVFGNAVFCVMARGCGELRGDPDHLVPVTTYAAPRRQWRARPWRCTFLHVPKAAGTTIWSHVAERIPSNIYFLSDATLRAFDGDINEFELVGGHVHAETLRTAGRIGHGFTVLRDPVERALSFVGHARRLAGYAGTLDPSFLLASGGDDLIGDAFRDQLLLEANQQVTMLGLREGETPDDGADIGRALARALLRLSDSSWTVGVQDDSMTLPGLVAEAFHVEADELARLNQTGDRASLVDGIAAAIRTLYYHPDTLCTDDVLVKVARAMQPPTGRVP